MPDLTIAAVQGGSRSLRGYLAVPPGDGPWPGVVAIHEALGLTDDIRRLADRLAGMGYLTLAPDLYSDGAWRCVVRTVRASLTGRGAALADIDAARERLLGDDRCTGRTGIIGFCLGGGFALVAATRGFDVSSVNYGQLPFGAREALTGACPVVGSYGAKDVSLRGAAGKLDRLLDDLGVEHDVKEYPSAGHSFLNPNHYGPGVIHPVQRVAHLGPDPAAAPDAWRRIEAFFAEHLLA